MALKQRPLMIIQPFFYPANLIQDVLFLTSSFQYETKFIFSRQRAYELKLFIFILFEWKFKYAYFLHLLMISIVWTEL
jgi:hypothetical protein